MFRSLVVPLDGSPLAAKALSYVRQLADADSRITLVGVVQPPLDEFFHDVRRAEITEIMERSNDLLWKEVERRAEELRARGLRAVTTVRRGDPTEEIIACARETAADLIVMTTHGWGGIRRWMLGSVANRVLHTTPIPTLTIRVAESDGLVSPVPIDRVILPLDGSVFAEQALPVAQELAVHLALPLDLIRVVDDQMPLSRHLAMSDTTVTYRLTEAVTAERAQAREYLDRIAAPLKDASCVVRPRVIIGEPATALADTINACVHSVVVLATHGQHGTAQWIFGSVAEKIVSTAVNPILALRPVATGTVPATAAPTMAATS